MNVALKSIRDLNILIKCLWTNLTWVKKCFSDPLLSGKTVLKTPGPKNINTKSKQLQKYLAFVKSECRKLGGRIQWLFLLGIIFISFCLSIFIFCISSSFCSFPLLQICCVSNLAFCSFCPCLNIKNQNQMLIIKHTDTAKL